MFRISFSHVLLLHLIKSVKTTSPSSESRNISVVVTLIWCVANALHNTSPQMEFILSQIYLLLQIIITDSLNKECNMRIKMLSPLCNKGRLPWQGDGQHFFYIAYILSSTMAMPWLSWKRRASVKISPAPTPTFTAYSARPCLSINVHSPSLCSFIKRNESHKENFHVATPATRKYWWNIHDGISTARTVGVTLNSFLSQPDIILRKKSNNLSKYVFTPSSLYWHVKSFYLCHEKQFFSPKLSLLGFSWKKDMTGL